MQIGIDLARGDSWTPCPRRACGGKLKPSKALAQTFVGGMPDFEGENHSSTFSAGGPGEMIDCLKCGDCGWSMTPLNNSEERK